MIFHFKGIINILIMQYLMHIFFYANIFIFSSIVLLFSICAHHPVNLFHQQGHLTLPLWRRYSENNRHFAAQPFFRA